MARHKMSIDIGYVPDWGVQEALRELFQNAIDHGSWSYAIDAYNTLRITSHDIILPCSTLLLGHSRKAEGSIGKFGEGYKLACLALARADKKVTIVTGRELWAPKLINSRTYQTKQLVFDTATCPGKPFSDTVFCIEGLTIEEIDTHRKLNLNMGYPEVIVDTERGTIINRQGDIFIHGLFVCHNDKLKYGYDFQPKEITIDRDRRMVRDFDLKWLTSQMWKESDQYDRVIEMIKAGDEDVAYLDSMIFSSQHALADKAAESFLVEHGPEAVPVVNQAQLDLAREEGHEKIIMVPQVQKSLMNLSKLYTPPPPKIVKKTPREELLDFERLYGDNMYGKMAAAFEGLLELSKTWRN